MALNDRCQRYIIGFIFALSQKEQIQARLQARKKLLEEVSKEKAVAKQIRRAAHKNQAASAAIQKALERVELAEAQQSETEQQLLEAQVSTKIQVLNQT